MSRIAALTSLSAKSLEIIKGLLGTGIRSFALFLVVLETLWGIALAALCFWIASQGSTLRGILAVCFALLAVTACTFVVASYFACLSVVRKAVSDAGLGRTIFDSLFNRVLGINGKDKGKTLSAAKVPTHMSKDEVKATLEKAASHVLSEEGPSAQWARPVFWIAKQIQRVSIGAAVKVIVTSCSNDGTSVNLFELRDRLASTVDERLVDHLKANYKRLAFTAISVVSIISVLVALGIRQLSW